jgi:hypothetical protein
LPVCALLPTLNLRNWTDSGQVKYIPLQAREGDIAIFLLSGATEVLYEGEKYFIVPQSAILMLCPIPLIFVGYCSIKQTEWTQISIQTDSIPWPL